MKRFLTLGLILGGFAVQAGPALAQTVPQSNGMSVNPPRESAVKAQMRTQPKSQQRAQKNVNRLKELGPNG